MQLDVLDHRLPCLAVDLALADHVIRVGRCQFGSERGVEREPAGGERHVHSGAALQTVRDVHHLRERARYGRVAPLERDHAAVGLVSELDARRQSLDHALDVAQIHRVARHVRQSGRDRLQLGAVFHVVEDGVRQLDVLLALHFAPVPCRLQRRHRVLERLHFDEDLAVLRLVDSLLYRFAVVAIHHRKDPAAVNGRVQMARPQAVRFHSGRVVIADLDRSDEREPGSIPGAPDEPARLVSVDEHFELVLGDDVAVVDDAAAGDGVVVVASGTERRAAGVLRAAHVALFGRLDGVVRHALLRPGHGDPVQGARRERLAGLGPDERAAVGRAAGDQAHEAGQNDPS